MGIAEQLHGIPAMAAVFSVLTGLIGAISAPYLFNVVHSLSAQVRGFALGTASHGIGAARAMQVDVDAGAYAGLSRNPGRIKCDSDSSGGTLHINRHRVSGTNTR